MHIKGYMDSIDVKHVSGWAIDLEHPDATLYVKIMLGEQLLGVVPANLHRDDLLQAGIRAQTACSCFAFHGSCPLRSCFRLG